MKHKQWWLDLAEVVDAWRVWPRIMLTVMLVFMWDVHEFYSGLDNPPFPQWYVTIAYGALSTLTGFYIATGRKWQ